MNKKKLKKQSGTVFIVLLCFLAIIAAVFAAHRSWGKCQECGEDGKKHAAENIKFDK